MDPWSERMHFGGDRSPPRSRLGGGHARTRSCFATAVAVFGWVATFAAPATAQTVSGTVREAATGRPVVGAMVHLVDQTNARVASFLTAADGRYSVSARSAGSHELVVERIGYAGHRVGPLELRSGERTVRDLVVSQAPVQLTGLVVEGSGRRCGSPSDDGGRTALLWDQVRKTLDVATWTKRHGALLLRVDQWQRVRDPGSLAVVDEARSRREAVGGNSVRSLAPEELARTGYVVEGDGVVDYYGPDAEALLSDEFLATHCFSVVSVQGASGAEIGLAFRPAPGRDVPDVSGVVWVEEASGRLDRIEFSYEGLGTLVSEHAGGIVRYAELPDGRWVVRDWHIRAPSMRQVSNQGALGRSERRMVDAVHETGSEVRSVRGTGWRWSPDRPTVTLVGSVYDSTASGPLAAAVIRVAGRGWRTRSGDDGTFRLPGLPEGSYRVLFEHPRLDSLGVGARGMDVSLQPGSDVRVSLTVPSRKTLLAETCPLDAIGVVVGRVTTPDGETPVPGATVTAGSPAADGTFETISGMDGSYRFCDLPPDRRYDVHARAGAITSAPAGVDVPADGYGVADFRLTWRAASSALDNAGVRVVGTVVDASSGRPVPGAAVTVLHDGDEAGASSVTDPSGRFQVVVPREGAPRLRFSSLGYRAAVSEPIPLRSIRHRVTVELASEAVEVEGVVVTVDARRDALDRVGFYQRERATGGVFLEREDLRVESTSRLSDALTRAVPGVQSFDVSSLTGNTTERRIHLRGAVRASGRQNCMPAIYIDGALVRWGVRLGEGNSAGYPTLDDLVNAADVQAVEVYETPSSTPANFMGPGSLCGVIVIWTG